MSKTKPAAKKQTATVATSGSSNSKVTLAQCNAAIETAVNGLANSGKDLHDAAVTCLKFALHGDATALTKLAVALNGTGKITGPRRVTALKAWVRAVSPVRYSSPESQFKMGKGWKPEMFDIDMAESVSPMEFKTDTKAPSIMDTDKAVKRAESLANKMFDEMADNKATIDTAKVLQAFRDKITELEAAAKAALENPAPVVHAEDGSVAF